jgi:hypothetical protein
MQSMSYAYRPFDDDVVAVLGVPCCGPTFANEQEGVGNAFPVPKDRWNADCYIPSAPCGLKDARHGDCPSPPARHCHNRHLHNTQDRPLKCDFVEVHRTWTRVEEAFVDNNEEVVAVDN